MKISIAGKNLKLGESLESYVEERVNSGIKKILKDIKHAEIVFSKNGYNFSTTILIKEGHGLGAIRSNYESDEIYHSFDGAFIRLEKQLRKHKDRYKDHKAKKIASLLQDLDENIDAIKYVLSPNAQESESGDQHLIIAENNIKIESLEVSEAVMKMDLNNVPALLFTNKSNGKLNIVYYRADGNISWVDPQTL
jgi:ribosomal subunit interface protein